MHDDTEVALLDTHCTMIGTASTSITRVRFAGCCIWTVPKSSTTTIQRSLLVAVESWIHTKGAVRGTCTGREAGAKQHKARACVHACHLIKHRSIYPWKGKLAGFCIWIMEPSSSCPVTGQSMRMETWCPVPPRALRTHWHWLKCNGLGRRAVGERRNLR